MATSDTLPNDTSITSSSSSSLLLTTEPSLTHNITFVQAHPSTFRAVVQNLTGHTNTKTTPTTHLSSPHKLLPPSRVVAADAENSITNSRKTGPRRPAFKLHERRQTARKLEIKLGNNGVSLATRQQMSYLGLGFGGACGEVVMVSPVSPLEMLASPARGSPRSPAEEEDKSIAEKGFNLLTSPLSTPRGSKPPELLPLFPLHSPRQDASSFS